MVEILGLKLYLSGVYTKNASGEVLTGSAASQEGPEKERSYYELIERVALDVFEQKNLETTGAGHRWRMARSNGVAAGKDLESAKKRAYLELWERDRILSFWYRAKKPHTSSHLVPSFQSAIGGVYELEVATFSDSSPFVLGIFGFPNDKAKPFICGFGAAETESEALKKAEGEVLQRMGFLWGEALPAEDPALAPTPLFHQEFYLLPKNYEKIRSWLREEGETYRLKTEVLTADSILFTDLTPPVWKSELSVVRAASDKAIPLSFGVSDLFNQRLGISRKRAIHPIA